jgi:hypothetical protein
VLSQKNVLQLERFFDNDYNKAPTGQRWGNPLPAGASGSAYLRLCIDTVTNFKYNFFQSSSHANGKHRKQPVWMWLATALKAGDEVPRLTI